MATIAFEAAVSNSPGYTVPSSKLMIARATPISGSPCLISINGVQVAVCGNGIGDAFPICANAGDTITAGWMDTFGLNGLLIDA